MWLLSVACGTFLTARQAGPVQPLSAAEITSWRAVQDELLPRLWQHLSRRAGEPAWPAPRPGRLAGSSANFPNPM